MVEECVKAFLGGNVEDADSPVKASGHQTGFQSGGGIGGVDVFPGRGGDVIWHAVKAGCQTVASVTLESGHILLLVQIVDTKVICSTSVIIGINEPVLVGKEEFDKSPPAIKKMKSLARDGVEQPDSRISANKGANSGGVEGTAPEVIQW